MPTTPVYGIPYPSEGDPIYEGAQQMRAMALGIDAALAAAEIPPTTASEIASCSMTRSTNLSIPNGADTFAAWTVTEWDTKPGGVAMASASGIYARTAGIYRVSAFAAWETDGFNEIIALTRTRSGISTLLLAEGDASAAWFRGHSLSTELALQAGDLIRLRATQTSGTARNLGTAWIGGAAWPRLSVTFVRPTP
ncbi:hypothetical protein [Tomitella biformata]|uniref:hypothetical protein n=1 Tax=Tomitella biformata TaxID=630403 RepID=UPI0004B0D9DC|nr:hypothetical protein [Tomitella biformata]